MKKYTKQIIYTLLIILFILFVVLISPKTMQNDTFWSIKVGEKLLDEGIFGIDDFSIHEGLYYIAHHFLTDILIYVIYSFSGFEGLYVLEVILALIMAGMIYLLNKQICKNKFVSYAMAILQMFIMASYIAVRAQMISYILFIVELLLLEKFKENNKKTYIMWLSIIPIVLANFHMGTVPFYFVILVVYIISLIKIKNPILKTIELTDKTRIKQLIIVGVIGIVTIFINPYFVDGVIYPFKTFGNEFINTTIQEFQPYNFGCDGGIVLFYMVGIGSLMFLSKERLKLGDLTLMIGTCFMGFIAIRYVGLFTICSSVAIRNLDILKKEFVLKKDSIQALKYTFIIVFSFIILFYTIGYIKSDNVKYIDDKNYPVEATKFLKEEITDKDRVFNEYEWGSYLMLNNIKVFIDSRCDLYTQEYNKTEIANDYNKLKACEKDYIDIINKYKLNIFVIRSESTLATLLNENENYMKMYSDKVTIIYKTI